METNGLAQGCRKKIGEPSPKSIQKSVILVDVTENQLVFASK
jgi:hypothetical protein